MNLNLSTYCNSSSYSLVGLNFLKSFIKLYPKSNISLFPLDKPNNQEPNFIPAISQGLYNSQTFDYEAPSLHINHQWMLANVRIGNKKCGMTFFEVDQLTPLEIHHLNYLDQLFVPTEWCASVIKNYCSVKTNVVSLGVDTDIFFPTKLIMNKPITTFLYIGKASLNKGTDFVISVFKKAFANQPNIRLWLSIHNPFVDMRKWYDEITRDRIENIKIIDRLNSQQEIAKLINQSTCLLAPARAESFNLPVLESMACGKPVILTDIGGHEHFHTDSNYFISTDVMEQANDEMFFKPNAPINQGNWAKLGKYQEEQCIEFMKNVHQKNMEEPIFCSSNIERAKELTWDKSARQLLVDLVETYSNI